MSGVSGLEVSHSLWWCSSRKTVRSDWGPPRTLQMVMMYWEDIWERDGRLLGAGGAIIYSSLSPFITGGTSPPCSHSRHTVLYSCLSTNSGRGKPWEGLNWTLWGDPLYYPLWILWGDPLFYPLWTPGDDPLYYPLCTAGQHLPHFTWDVPGVPGQTECQQFM